MSAATEHQYLSENAYASLLKLTTFHVLYNGICENIDNFIRKWCERLLLIKSWSGASECHQNIWLSFLMTETLATS